MENVILQTAYRLFTSQGIQPFTMDEIASRLAISKKTLYRFFDSRHHLVQQVCALVAENYETAMAEADTLHDTLERVLAYLVANIRFCKKTSPVFFTDLQKHYPLEFASLIKELNTILPKRLLKMLQQGIVEGVFRGSLHPELLVVILQQHIQKDFEFAAELVSDYSKDEVFRQAMFMFLYGVIAADAIPRLEEHLNKYPFNSSINFNS